MVFLTMATPGLPFAGLWYQLQILPNLKTKKKMKNLIKSGLAALALSVTLASCHFGNKSKNIGDTVTVSAKTDSTSTPKIDTAGKTDSTGKKITAETDKK